MDQPVTAEPQAPETFNSFADALDASISKVVEAHKETIPGARVTPAQTVPGVPDKAPVAPVVEPAAEVPPVVEPAVETPPPADPFKAIEIPAVAPEPPKVEAPAAPVTPDSVDAKIDAKYSDKPPGKVTDAASKSWAGMRTDLKTAEKKVVTLEAQLTEKDARLAELQAELAKFSDKQAIAKDEWEKVQKERSDLSTVVKLTNLEKSPEYQQTVSEPLSKIHQVAEALATKHGLDPKKFIAALSEPDADTKANALSELVEGMHFLDQQKVAQMSEAIELIDQKKSALRQDVDKSLEAIKQNRTKAQEMSVAQVKQAKDNGLKAARANYEQNLWLLRKGEGDEWKEWNAEVDRTHDVVAQIAHAKMEPTQFASMCYSAVLLPKAITAVKQADARIKELETALSKYQRATPGAGSGGAATGERPAAVKPEASFVDSILSQMPGR